VAVDRKAAIREYRDRARPAGMFCVRNTATGRVFLGGSVDLPSMLNRQRFQLEMGGHASRELQTDWNASGPDAFAIEVVDTLDDLDDANRDLKAELESLLEMWDERLPGARYRI
jgi:hypothetical protein